MKSIVVVQSLRHVQLCDPMDCSTSGFPVLHYLPEFAQTHVHWVSDVIQPSHPLPPPSPLALNLSQHHSLFQWVGSSHQVAKVLDIYHQSFQWIFRADFLSTELALCIRWPEYWSFSFSISPSNEYPGLVSFIMDWLDLLAAQRTLRSLLQHHSSKASILWCSAFFMVHLSHPYKTTGKTIALTRWALSAK